MLDIGWSELMVIGVVALIVVGPKDLPVMFRTLGRFTAKARSMAREFQRAMDKAADDSGIKGVAKDLKAVTSPSSLGIDALQSAASRFEKWDPLKPAAKPAAVAASLAMAAKSADPTPADPTSVDGTKAGGDGPAGAETPSLTAAPQGPSTAAFAAQRAEAKAAVVRSSVKAPVVSEAAEAAKPVSKRKAGAKPADAAMNGAVASVGAEPKAKRPRAAKKSDA